MKREPLYIRFWRHVDKSGSCWTWTAAKSADGYGRIRVQSPKRGDLNAHRVGWELTFGPIPPGAHILHRCDNRACVRPDHLFIGTNADNVADRVAKGRSRGAAGVRNRNARLSQEDVAEIRMLYRPSRTGAPRKSEARPTTSTLAERFGVTRSTIYHIARGWTWKE